jgi:hypothetical protein
MSQTKNKKHIRRSKQRTPWLLLMLIGGGLLLVTGAIFAITRPSQPKAPIEVTGAPSLKVDQEEINLKDVKLGQTVEVSFQLTNVGDKALRFSEAPYIEVMEGC